MLDRKANLESAYPPARVEEVEYVPPPGLLIQTIAPDSVLTRLGLNYMPNSLRGSVKRSTWQEVAGGRIMLEVRNPSKLTAPRLKDVHAIDTHVLDFDDCMFDATGWHKKEYELVSQFGVSRDTAKDIYENSKIIVPKIAENEPRYTPEVNLILLSRYTDLLSRGVGHDGSMKAVGMWREMILETIAEIGELPALSGFGIDPDIRKAFVGNAPNEFVHDGFVEDVIGGTERNDLRIIATRGKIEGPLGQVDKVHRSGVLEPYGGDGNTVDLVIYTSDIKAEALLDVLRLMPMLSQTAIRVYDDNPKEVLPYIESARRQGVMNLEVIQVEHPTAKRRGMKVGIEPDFTLVNDTETGEPRTNFNHYSASPQQAFCY